MIEARKAIEALRAGVPNGAAVVALGTHLGSLSTLFLERLEERESLDGDSPGLVISGDFGSGKSHALGYFRELALARDYAASVVTISKETPLFDPLRLYEATIRATVVPRQNDDIMTLVVAALRAAGSASTFLGAPLGELEPALSPIFSAVLHVASSNKLGAEDVAAIARFFATGRLSKARLSGWLRTTGSRRLFDIQMPKGADLASQLFRLAPRLIRAAGYRAWVILLDEVELLARYSSLQRGRSYAELGRLLAQDGSTGVLTVAAITGDFCDVVFGRRKDDEVLRARMGLRLNPQQAAWMDGAIAHLDRQATRLRPPSHDDLLRTQADIAALYTKAYRFEPALGPIGERLADRSFRQYIKGWITRWDLARLYGATDLHMDVGTVAASLDESPDFEAPPEDSPPEEE